MLTAKTPIGPIAVPEWQERELTPLTDDELLQKALNENEHFCISPATYAMVEKKFLTRVLQQKINANVGLRHDAHYHTW